MNAGSLSASIRLAKLQLSADQLHGCEYDSAITHQDRQALAPADGDVGGHQGPQEGDCICLPQ